MLKDKHLNRQPKTLFCTSRNTSILFFNSHKLACVWLLQVIYMLCKACRKLSKYRTYTHPMAAHNRLTVYFPVFPFPSFSSWRQHQKHGDTLRTLPWTTWWCSPNKNIVIIVMVHFAISHFAVSNYLTLNLTPNPNPNSNPNPKPNPNPNPTPRKREAVK